MSKRIYTNQFIQEKLAEIVKSKPIDTLNKFCTKEYSKSIFDINYPLLVKAPTNWRYEQKRELVKDNKGVNRWTWKYEFQKKGFSYAITTQWYDRNDEYVQRWLRKQI